MSSENAQEPKNHTSTDQDSKSHWKSTKTNANRIMTIHIESFGGPEHDNGEKIGARYKGNEQGETERSRLLLNSRREDGILRSVDLPEHESNQEGNAENQWNQHMGTRPRILDIRVSIL